MLFLVPSAASGSDGLAEGRSLFEAARYEAAAEVFENLLDADGDDAEAYYYLGMIRYYAGDYEAATKFLEKAVQLEDRNISYRNALGDVYRDRLRGASFISARKWSGKWKKLLESSHAIAPHNIEVFENLIGYYLHAPGIAGGDKKKGKRLAEEMVEVSEVEGRLMLAYAYRRMDRPDLAAVEYQKVIDIEPVSFKARGYWGFMLMDEEDFPAAERKFKEALEIAGDKPNVYFYFGEYHSRLENWDEAIAQYRRALEIEPKFSDARYAMGRAYEKKKNNGKAVAQYEDILELTPGHYAARDARSRLKKMGRRTTRR